MNKKIKNTLFLRRQVPGLHMAEKMCSSFSASERLIFWTLISTLSISALFLALSAQKMFLVEQPSKGGTLHEGLIFFPHLVNPLLAVSDVDRDLVALIYSGLLKVDKDGNLTPDIAENFSISADGLSYTFTIKDGLRFHDGEPLTVEDVIFTIQKAQDPSIRSPKRANWEGVTVEKISDREIKLSLKQPYAPFLENTTLGIIPKHFWKNVRPEEFPLHPLNSEPIGSGLYAVSKIERKSSGSATKYELKTIERGTGKTPYITKVILSFYPNETALLSAYDKKEIESIGGISPEIAKKLEGKGGRIARAPLPRVFGVFFNQNQARVLANKEVREALLMAVPRQLIVDSVLAGYGTILENPIPPWIISISNKTASPQKNATSTIIKTEKFLTATSTEIENERIETAKKILTKAGWKLNPEKHIMEKKSGKETVSLTFTLSTGNAPELAKATGIIRDEWQKIGAEVELKLFEDGDLKQSVIRPRKYDALFFGEVVGRDLDLFAFWHSSQRNDPGLNIALYTNAKADKLLEETRAETDKNERFKKYLLFAEEVRKDTPAIFIYSPDFLYVLPKKLKGFKMEGGSVPSERFMHIEDWYLDTEKIWKIFSKQD